jgi:hypothetical protein
MSVNTALRKKNGRHGAGKQDKKFGAVTPLLYE